MAVLKALEEGDLLFVQDEPGDLVGDGQKIEKELLEPDEFLELQHVLLILDEILFVYILIDSG